MIVPSHVLQEVDGFSPAFSSGSGMPSGTVLDERLNVTLKSVNCSRARAMLILPQLSSASPGLKTARTKVLSVRREMMRLNRGLLMKNSLNWLAEADVLLKVLGAC